jgi:hypothetical protein
MNTGVLIDDMDAMQIGLQSLYGGTVSYTFSVASTWLDASIVNWTFDSPTLVPTFIYVTTEDFYYAISFQSQVITPTVCNDCQFIQLNQCGADDFRLDLGLPDGSYTAFYFDNTSQIVYEQGTYSDSAQGGLSMYQWNATVGMFNPYSFYTLTIHDNNGAPISWTVDGVEYSCATLTFKTTVNITD